MNPQRLDTSRRIIHGVRQRGLAMAIVGGCTLFSMMGCRSKLTCEAIAKRNATCSEAFVEEAKRRTRAKMAERLASLPEAERKKMVAKMEASFKESAKEVRATVESDEFLQNCRASWQDPSKMPKALKEELARCLSLPDCEGYATCFMDSAALSP
ncbi:MAG TPA: hypothetical protein PKL73_21490 [Polyangiaceae bacterium]|nr:hypothetical protein [Polyangiaceae bacterium]HNZ25161.1 hypothetical protein [Polyangiaceae bacterium]HOD24120.1 hypothetical protein [Polyangiaceae bacterium]HOE51242.1 hypothetical protein [Polyangiaceae bacterium]HOH03245.1 hypothetical protein [Polyangiaceae bacterium]